MVSGTHGIGSRIIVGDEGELATVGTCDAEGAGVAVAVSAADSMIDGTDDGSPTEVGGLEVGTGADDPDSVQATAAIAKAVITSMGEHRPMAGSFQSGVRRSHV